jgi:hypothetical protein
VLCPAMNDRMFAHAAGAGEPRALPRRAWATASRPGLGPARGRARPRARAACSSRTRSCSTSAGRSASAPLPRAPRARDLGPTREAVDPVRFVGKPLLRPHGPRARGSGLAARCRGDAGDRPGRARPAGRAPRCARRDRGADARRRPRRIGEADVVLFAAAVADFRRRTSARAR